MKLDITQMMRASGVRRRRAIMRPITPTQVQAHELYRVYLPVISTWETQIRDRLMPEYSRTIAGLTGDSVIDLEAIIRFIEEMAGVLIQTEIRAGISAWAIREAEWHFRRFVANLKYVTNVDLASILGPQGSQVTMQDFLVRNTALISDVSDQVRGRVADIVFRNVQLRTPVRDVAREISVATGLGRKRALRIAMDQTQKISASLDRERMLQVGIASFEWQHSGKAHPRLEHVARDKKIFRWDSEVALTDPPGFAPFCFPSGEPVSIYSDVFRFWRRWHRGHLTTFITNQGVTVNCTPNHPILTSSGWKSAKDLQVGEDVFNVGASGFDGFDVDVKQTQSSIGNLFEALQSIFGFVSVNGAGGEFHGDGSVNEVIDVVEINGGLRNSVKSLVSQDCVKLVLEKSTMIISLLLGCGPIKSLGETGNLVGPGGMGRVNLLASFLLAHLAPDEVRGDALISEVNAAFVEHMGETVTRNAESIADGFQAFPGDVSARSGLVVVLLGLLFWLIDGVDIDPELNLEVVDDAALAEIASGGYIQNGLPFGNIVRDSVREVSTKEWNGHVYNLQTATGWFAVASLAVHNCGCKARGVLNL